MNKPPAKHSGPIRELLDDFNRMSEARRTFTAMIASIVVHFLIFGGGGLLVFHFQAKPAPEKKPLEVVLIIPPAPQPALAAATPTPPPKPEILTPQESAQLEEKFRALPLEIQREYLDVDGRAQKKKLTNRALLESGSDSVAVSVQPGKGDSPLPAQDGRDLPFNQFKDQQASLGKEPNQSAAEASQQTPSIFKPQPIAKNALDPAPKGKPVPKVAEVAKITTKEEPPPNTPPPSNRLSLASLSTPSPLKKVREAAPDEIPMFLQKPEPAKAPEFTLRPEPTPPPQRPTPAPTPEPVKLVKNPALAEIKKPETDERLNVIQARLPSQLKPQPVSNPGYAPHQVMTKNDGGSAPPGANGVDAVATLSGKYKKGLNSIVGSRWTYFVKDPRFSSLISAGQTTVHFTIDARGKIIRVKVTDNTSNSAHAQLCERAFVESQRDIDPPPAGVLRGGVYEDTLTFVLY